MKAIIDLACKDFSHEMFNAGTVNQIYLAFPKDEIVYFAEKNQLSCVKKIIENEYGSLKEKGIFCHIRFEEIDFDIYKNCEFDILQGIIDNNKNITSIVITSHTFKKINEICNIIKENENIKFFMFLHGEIEYLLKENGIPKYRLPLNMNHRLVIRQLLVLLSWIKRPVVSHKDIMYFRKYLDYIAMLDNVSLIVFSNEFNNYSHEISKNVINKLNIFYLPYVYEFSPKIHELKNTVKIGIMPSTMHSSDAYAIEIIDFLQSHRKNITSDYTFKFIGSRIDKWVWKNMEENISLVHKFPLSREEINQFIRSCDWILLPYGKEKYKLSSSGVLYDAINMEIPIIMGSSACFNDYKQYSIGIHTDTFREICDQLIHLINHRDKKQHSEYIKNIRNLKWKMNDYNVKKFRKLMI